MESSLATVEANVPNVFTGFGISIHSNKATMDEIERFEQFILDNGEAKEIPIRHFFSNGVYAREMSMDADDLVVGRVHRLTNLNILSKGEVSVLTENGIERVSAPFTIVSPPGTKRIIYAHSDCVWTTILPTELLDADEIEESLTCAKYADFVRLESKGS